MYEEALCFPLLSHPAEWGSYCSGYRRRHGRHDADGSYDVRTLRQRQRSLSHAALIKVGNDERLMLLAASIMPLPFTCNAHCPSPLVSTSSILLHKKFFFIVAIMAFMY